MLRCLAFCSVLAVCISLRTSEDASTEWYDWCPRVPELASACRWGDVVQVWSAMKGKAWRQFVDWRDQPMGVHVYDMTANSFIHGQDGNYSGHVLAEYRRWRQRSAWTRRWNAQRFQELSEDLMGGHAPYLRDDDTTHRCHHKVNRPRCVALGRELGEPDLMWIKSWSARLNESDRLFREYYREVDPLERTILGKPLQRVLDPLVRLYAKQGLLHPARNANSRSRLFVLQTELVRHGGHPVMLEDIDRMVYNVTSLAELKKRILEGWCAWEWSFRTGASPVQAVFTNNRTFVGDQRTFGGQRKFTCHEPSMMVSVKAATSRLYSTAALEDDMDEPEAVSAEELDRLRAEYAH